MESGPLDEFFRAEEKLWRPPRTAYRLQPLHDERPFRDPIFGDSADGDDGPAPREQSGDSQGRASGARASPYGQPCRWSAGYEERRRRDPIFGDLDQGPPDLGIRGRSPYRRSPLTRSPTRSRSSRPRRRPRRRVVDGQDNPRSSRSNRGDRGAGTEKSQHGRWGSAMVWGQYHMTIENVPYDMVGLELKELARAYSWSKTMTFARTYRRGPVCYGMLEFTDGEDMRKAIKELDCKMIEGSPEKTRCYEGNNYHEVWRPEEHLKG